MAPCQVSFDVQNPRGGTAPGNRTFTGHVFLFAHGHCELQWDHTQACATDFLAHNTCGTRAYCASTKTTRFGLTTHPWVRYHLSFLQVLQGTPTALERRAKSEVAHKWARWLHHPCRLGDPHRFRAGGKIRSVQKSASPLHYGGSLAKGTKSKVAKLGARTTLWMSSPKEHHQKNFAQKIFAQMMCLRQKTPLKLPLRPFLKRVGGFKTPHAIGFLRNPPPLLPPSPPPRRPPSLPPTSPARPQGTHQGNTQGINPPLPLPLGGQVRVAVLLQLRPPSRKSLAKGNPST